MDTIEVHGSNLEIGLQLGEHFKRQIKEVLDYVNDLYKLNDKITFKQAANMYRLRIIDTYYTHIFEQLKGMSIGSDTPLDNLLAFSLEDDLMANFGEKCSTIAINKDSLLLAHNEDWDEHCPLAIIKGDIDGVRFITVSYIGKIIGNGMTLNDYGFAYSGNSIYCNKEPAIGLPKEYVMGSLLKAQNIEEAFDLATFKGSAASHSIMMADAAQLASLELSHESYHLEVSDKLVHTNHLVNLRNGDPNNNIKETSIKRYNHMLKFDGNLKNLMSSHRFKPFSVCRHNGDIEGDFHSKTLASVIINTTNKSMMIAQGCPCENEYGGYAL